MDSLDHQKLERALRNCHLIGTILVDLETRQPIALLPDRTAETLATWLKEHPGIEILSRDRSKTYRKGMNEGAPDAIQVADRFHLLKNLEETLEKVFKRDPLSMVASRQFFLRSPKVRKSLWKNLQAILSTPKPQQLSVESYGQEACDLPVERVAKVNQL